MTTLHNILSAHDSAMHATAHGTQMHGRLQHIVIDGPNTRGDSGLVRLIQRNPDLVPFFAPNSRVEVPIAGTINNRFISRRIDRLRIDDDAKSISILDYKTDINHNTFRDKYIIQLREYMTLLRTLYPDYKISAYILWTHDFSLEKLPVKPL